MTFDTTSVVNTAIGALPGIIGLIRADHAARNPGAPPLTDEGGRPERRVRRPRGRRQRLAANIRKPLMAKGLRTIFAGPKIGGSQAHQDALS
jgi:hypothetical protein